MIAGAYRLRRGRPWGVAVTCFMAAGLAAGSVAVAAKGLAADSPFAASVVAYAPAPGHWVQEPAFSDPDAAVGAPAGAGTAAGDLTSVVSLGGFGGSITLAFDHTVLDDPGNPFGVDAIVFGNAFWRGDRDTHWAECATIEIALDSNGNGLADDPWYLIPGSHLVDPAGRRTVATWDDLVDDPTYPPEYEEWVPPGASGVWTTEGYLLPAEVFGTVPVHNPEAGSGTEGIYGYAEYSPTLILGDMDADDDTVECPGIEPAVFYTTPDNPMAAGMTPGCGGGDAFDIAWAIDPGTEQSAGLAGFDFIRITSAVDFVHPLFDELSAEVDAVADVAPDRFGDLDGDGDADLGDVAELQVCRGDRKSVV